MSITWKGQGNTGLFAEVLWWKRGSSHCCDLAAFMFCVKFIVEWLGLSRSCIYKRISRYRHAGTDSFANAPCSGRPLHLSAKQFEEVLSHLETSRGVFSCQSLVSQFNFPVSAETLHRYLHRSKYTCKRPKHVAPESPDPQKQDKLAQIEHVKKLLSLMKCIYSPPLAQWPETA